MKITDLHKGFDNFSLHIESLEITEKKIYGLIGPNGCGKTTVMKLMAGLASPESGTIDYENLARQDITMVMRKPYLLHDTVYRNLVYPLKLRKIKPDKDLIEHYLEITGLSNRRDEYAPQLSGGEQQKLALARALIFSPSLIFIDEAFSNMDIESVAFFENYILEEQKKHPRTWVIISHQLSIIKRLCDYVYFMYNGKIAISGATNEVLESSENEKLKQFLKYQ